jgi:hypothetical protein
MSAPVFNAKITLNSSTQTGPDSFELQFGIIDMQGIFSGFDVAVGDIVYIDTSGSVAGSVSKYEITSVVSQNATDVTAQVVFYDKGATPIDPSSGIFLDGFIARVSYNGQLAITPDPQTQILPNKFAIQTQNDNFNTFKAPTVVKRWVMGEACVRYQPLCKAPDGKGYKSGSDGANRQNVHAIALQSAAGVDSIIDVALISYNLAGALTGLGFAPGDKVFIGETPGSFVNTISAFSGNNDSILWAGWADCADGVADTQATDLIYDFEVIGRPG